ncbi:MAG: carboxypeptidase-like regulatory domain-containing protein [Terracidiphilus sp.]
MMSRFKGLGSRMFPSKMLGVAGNLATRAGNRVHDISNGLACLPGMLGRWSMTKLNAFLLVTCLSMLCMSAPLVAQRSAASISGTVTDQSGAVIPGALVTVTEITTGVSTTAQANGQGFYVVTNLQAGTYRVHVESAGFEKYERTGIEIQVGQPRTADVAMTVGATSQQVTVTGAPPLVDTSNQTVSFAITTEFTDEIPLNGRNITQLLALAPDSSDHNAAANNYSNQTATRPETGAAGFVTASGEARENSSTYYLDGGLDEDTYTDVANMFPNPDAVEEFTVDTNSSSAKFGGRGGAVVNAVTRGGTNGIHGTAFEYVRNGDLNASNYFSTSPDTLKRNQFGFSLGGPLKKDKTFWFGSFQRTTFRYGTTSNIAFGPTAAELNGDWSSSLAAAGGTLTDPLTGQAFTNGQVPTSLYNPISLKVLGEVPTGDPNTGQFNYLAEQLQNDNQYVARVDHHMGDRMTISASYLWDQLAQPNIADPKDIVTGGMNNQWTSQHAALNLVYRLNNNLLTTVGGTLSRVVLGSTGASQFQSLADLGANYPVWDPKGVHEVGIYVGGWFSAYWIGAQNVKRNQEDFTNTWTYIKGQHTLDFGAEIPFSQSVLYQAYVSSGYQGWWCANSGSAPLDFMLGDNCFFEQYAPSYVAPRGYGVGMYANDAWRISPRLTVNLGARWEPWTPWADSSKGKIGGQINLTDYANGVHSTRYPGLPAGFLVRGDSGVPSGLSPSDMTIVDPRVGLAWDMSGNGKTSLRAGFGIYHDQPFGRMYNEMTSTEPFTEGDSITDTTVSAYDPYSASPYNGSIPVLQNPPPSNTVFALPLTMAIGFSPSFKPPATMQWNFTVEHQLPWGVLLRTGYEASESYHMFDSRDINSGINEVRPMTGGGYGGKVILNESSNTASYNALAVSAEKRMTGNLSFLGGFRWAKCLDEAGSNASFAFNEFTDPRRPWLDRGHCDSDVAGQFKLAAVWRAPKFQGLGFAGREVIGGWTMSGVLTRAGGFPFSVMATGDTNETGDDYNRANLIGDPHTQGKSGTLQEWFNTAAFAVPQDADGNSPRNFLRGPESVNLDYALIKSFAMPFGPFRDAQKIDFRAEAFNLFNHPNFGAPDNATGDSTFGSILSAGSPRIMQLALKFVF